ncbi:patatin-like phospholipase family protein [Mesorhizobium sp.]|uniref:patatin-like phospholipase family protein n=1 Tax=Mesorhizobium sp. TaxID=1871066 RepID=UPI00257D24FC|nr:patatin-like phospholipase family protein [Mesorhizobium sp.]
MQDHGNWGLRMKYCDLVMKGGITSGLVYPNAVLALTRQFRFKNIGGTSAGAIAAAITAAAAYGDRQKRSSELPGVGSPKIGFAGLEGVAKKLTAEGFIFGLFQPAAGARNAYRLLVTLTGEGSQLMKAATMLFAVLIIAPIEAVLTLAIFLGLGLWIDGLPGVWSAAVPAALCAYAAAAAFAVLRIARVTRRNFLGICNGMPSKPWLGKAHPALTEWLHEAIQELAGKPANEPLTFAELWAAPRYDDEPKSERAISLQMISTDVSHHEPRSIPFENARFWFRQDQFEMLFPSSVIAAMTRGKAPTTIGEDEYFELPHAGALPVVVGMRMSLSFPILISAVPLHEAQYRRHESAADDVPPNQNSQDSVLSTAEALTTGGTPGGAQARSFRVCWFSDGGISSNFPIHLFDAALPRWPTFAINLVGTRENEGRSSTEVFLPSENNQGWQQSYHSIAAPSAARELSNFLFGIIATMQNWRDLLQSRAPGHRDRIAHVPLSSEEGGLNLNMPQSVLDSVAAKGTAAGGVFSRFSFDNHYWVRWRNVAAALQRYTIQVAENAKSTVPDYAGAHSMAESGNPEPPSYQFRSQDRQAAAEALLKSLEENGAEWSDLGPDLTIGAPRPLPQLRITPTY